ncbi:MAG: hypothetical protein PHW04_00715 [Candidatus Wallbacteria bacterium]|nr:hypothetical protein [Candidatus Wallbacteria bacterium]
MKMWKCRCGIVYQEKSSVCSKCGQILVEQNDNETTSGQVNSQSEDSNLLRVDFFPRKPLTIEYFIGIAAFIIALIAVEIWIKQTPAGSIVFRDGILWKGLTGLWIFVCVFRKRIQFWRGVLTAFLWAVLFAFLFMGACTLGMLNMIQDGLNKGIPIGC